MNATNSSKESSDKSQESCGKKTKCAVSGNRHDMDSSMGGNREAAGGGMVAEENHQVVNANATMQKDKSSTTKMKPRLNYHSNIIIRKRKVNEYSTLSKQEKASKSKRKKDRCQGEDEMANKDAKQKKRKTSDSHPAVPAGIDVSDLIHHEANMDDGTDMHTMNAREKYEHEKWNTLFMELVEYKDKNGHCNIPTKKNRSLGTWIYTQRALFRSKKLKADRHEKLVEIGFAFEAVTALEFKGKFDQKWQEMYQKLLKSKEMKGHCFDLPQTLPLGRWLSRQRQLYTNGKLRDDRAEKLLSAGFNDKKGLKKVGAVGVRDAASGQPPRKKRKVLDLVNDLAAITHDEEEKGIDDINDYGDGNDNGNAHEEIVEEHVVAGTELVEEGSITEKDGNVTSFAEMPALHSPPPVNSKTKCNQAYESKHHENWNRHFMELVKYKQKNRHCNVPTKNGSLGEWISTQRTLFRSKKLKADRYEKLVGIGFVFENASLASNNVKWNKFFVELVEYKEKNGHCNFPTTNGGSFVSWVSTQRTLFRSKKLKEDRYEKLVGIGFA